MNPKKFKIKAIFASIFFLIILGNILRMRGLDSMRAVDALQLLACGIMIGVMIVNVALFMKFKDKK